MKKRLSFVFILLIILISTACSNGAAEQSSDKKKAAAGSEVQLTISAAASLTEAMKEIQDAFQKEYPEISLKFNFGGSGSLQRQISQGAPVDLFFSADEDKFNLLIEKGKIAKEDAVDLLGNSLVLVVPKGKQSIKNFEDLTKSEIGNISIGTPETVPAGKYAKESLEKMGIWDAVESKTVYAKDVRQVLSYVETGNVDAGMIYKTDARTSDKVEIVVSANPATHTAITYPVGIVKDTQHYEAAKKFYDFLQQDYSLKVFEDYGFTVKQ